MQRRALSSKRPDTPTEGRSAREVEQRDLSPRQHQILEMLRAGKVNKEIARELGIGLGTVKQHVVALFKKLDVSNRAMAVSRGIHGPQASRSDAMPAHVIEGLLEYRPCVVFSAAIDESAPQDAGKRMQQVLAGYASRHDALFLARKGHAGDLIIGIERASEQDLFLALRAARTVHAELAESRMLAGGLRGGLTAGLAVASMHRTGGWSGEAVASIAITQGRDLAGRAAPGELLIASAARELISVQNPNAPGAAPEALHFENLHNMPWQLGPSESDLLGRQAELQVIDAMLEGLRSARGGLLQLSGETGMGKSRLCRHVAARVTAAGGKAYHFACRPDGDLAIPFVTLGGLPVSTRELVECLAAAPAAAAEAVIVDDCHFLPAKDLAMLSQLAVAAAGKLVLMAARRFADSGVRPANALRLSRLDADAIQRLATAALGASRTPAKIASVVRRAAGVPLFAIELARQRKPDMLPLTLRALIGARLDGMKLDRAMLRRIARSRAAWNLEGLVREMNEPQDSVQAAAAYALAAGVLNRDDLGKLRFSHPLVRQAIDLGCVE